LTPFNLQVSTNDATHAQFSLLLSLPANPPSFLDREIGPVARSLPHRPITGC
jgi:hypothetical protein